MATSGRPAVVRGAPAIAESTPHGHRIEIVLAYHQDMVRSALGMFLGSVDDFLVVDEAASVEGAVRCVRSIHPRVLVLDLDLPRSDCSVMAAIAALRTELPETEIVVMSLDGDLAVVQEATAAGAIACISTSAKAEELVEAVRRAASGQAYLSAEVLNALAGTSSHARPNGLTLREVEVIGLIAKGYTHAEIAELLFLSVRTVESHRARIQMKLGRLTRAELVAYAHEHGMANGVARR
ncbi:MAG: response regulator transcription factor [Solirubrobacteraceae bacterium]